MYLLINPSIKDGLHLSLFNEKGVGATSILEGVPNRDFLLIIDSFLKKQKLAKEKVQGIAVVVGAGGFTSIRLATTIANTFGYILHIPLTTVHESDLDSLDSVAKKLGNTKPGVYISASYSGEPNIGKKK